MRLLTLSVTELPSSMCLNQLAEKIEDIHTGYRYATLNATYFRIQTSSAFFPTPEEDIDIAVETPATYLPPAASDAISYAYRNTAAEYPFRKLLADIFAYNAKPDAVHEDILSFPAEFLADVLLINMKRLPLRLANERAAFDADATEYYIAEPDT